MNEEQQGPTPEGIATTLALILTLVAAIKWPNAFFIGASITAGFYFLSCCPLGVRRFIVGFIRGIL